MKWCNTCPDGGRVLDESCFARDKSKKDGLAANCRECNKRRCREWYKRGANADKQVEKVRKRRELYDEQPASARRPRLKQQPPPARAEFASMTEIVRFTPTLHAALTAQAEERGCTIDQLVREIVADFIHHREEPCPKECSSPATHTR